MNTHPNPPIHKSVFLLIITLLVFLPNYTLALDVKKLFKNTRDSVVLIMSFDQSNQPLAIGSGFFVESSNSETQPGIEVDNASTHTLTIIEAIKELEDVQKIIRETQYADFSERISQLLSELDKFPIKQKETDHVSEITLLLLSLIVTTDWNNRARARGQSKFNNTPFIEGGLSDLEDQTIFSRWLSELEGEVASLIQKGSSIQTEAIEETEDFPDSNADSAVDGKAPRE